MAGYRRVKYFVLQLSSESTISKCFKICVYTEIFLKCCWDRRIVWTFKDEEFSAVPVSPVFSVRRERELCLDIYQGYTFRYYSCAFLNDWMCRFKNILIIPDDRIAFFNNATELWKVNLIIQAKRVLKIYLKK